jgi:uncharacterized protein
MPIRLRRSVFLLALGWIPGLGLAAEPSFDCAAAGSDAETAICADAGLAALDRELARLYGLALADADLDAERRASLQATQRGWIKGRDDCWKADDFEACIAAAYALRIHEIREGYAAARTEADAGVSIGPTAWACDGLDALLSVTFVNTDPAFVAIRWRDAALVLPQAVSASGARYASETEPGGKALFWTKGDQALFAAPGGPELACAMVETG